MQSHLNQTTHLNGADLLSNPGSVILPGTDLAKVIPSKTSDGSHRVIIRAGTGLVQNGANLQSTKAGIFCIEPSRNRIWMENNQKRYVPALNDNVIAVVIEKHSDEYRLDINATDTAILSALAFQGATKKNKPNLPIGSLVYCRIIRANLNMETQVSCIESGSNKSWISGETKYGQLKNGNMIRVSLALTRSLIRSKSHVLNLLGNHIEFQSAVGVNGRVWVEAQSIQKSILLSIAINKADSMQLEEWNDFVKALIGRSSKSSM